MSATSPMGHLLDGAPPMTLMQTCLHGLCIGVYVKLRELAYVNLRERLREPYVNPT
jgi:hypothetical protein